MKTANQPWFQQICKANKINPDDMLSIKLTDGKIIVQMKGSVKNIKVKGELVYGL